MNLSVSAEEAEKLKSWVEGLNGTLCVLTHRNADPDAIASAAGLAELASRIKPSVTPRILLSEGVEAPSKKILEVIAGNRLDLEPLSLDSLGLCAGLAVVDSSTSDQVGLPLEAILRLPTAIIDHHELNELTELGCADVLIHHPEASSTSELIAGVAARLNLRLSPSTSSLLIAGILYDTRVLRLAAHETFTALAYLTMWGGDYRRCLALLTSREVSWSEKVARLKGISRAGLYRLGDNFILAITCVGAHESSVLKLLIDAGADVAIAVAKRRGLTRVTVRVATSLIKALRGKPIASDLAKHLAARLNGSGGGHAGAAGMQARRDVKPQELLKLITEFFMREGLRISTLEEGRWITECE